MKKSKKILVFVLLMCLLVIPTVFAGPATAGNGCVLGPKVTKDLIGVLRAFRIAAPLLMIGFTIFETIQSLTKGDGAAELKKVFNRLKKRVLYVVILIFIPTLVQLGLNAMGLTSQCDLQGIDDTSAAPPARTQSCTERCESIGDREGRQACLNSCATSPTQSCKDRCESIGDREGREACFKACT